MEFVSDCFTCAMRQAYSAAALVSDDEDFRYRCLAEASRILAEAERGLTPPQMGQRIYGMVSRVSGDTDPFKEEKEQQNQSALEQLDWLREKVCSSEIPLLMAVRLAIAGNIVDPGAQESYDLEKSVMEAISGEAHLEAYPALVDRLESAETILYLADNCGEIVFDRVLVETIKEIYDVEVTLAVRAVPIINDVTEKEARDVGLDSLCRILSSGSRMPGTYLPETTREFRDAFYSSDVVISKGQGNWETLEDADRELFFLFQVKCSVVSRITGCPIGCPLLWKT